MQRVQTYIGPQLPPCVRCLSVAGPLNLQKIASFLFLYFSKIFFTEIYFQFHNLQFYTHIARQGGGRGRQGGGSDLYVNKNKFILRRGPLREPAAPLRAAGPLPPRPAGGRQVPSPNIKLRPFLLRPHFLPTRSREGRGREEG